LRSVIMEPEIRKLMKDEDTILIEFEDMQREIMRQRENARVAKQEASEAKQRIAIAVQKMRSKGISTEDISEITGLSKEEVEAV
jgi:predicted transposase YdaD